MTSDLSTSLLIPPSMQTLFEWEAKWPELGKTSRIQVIYLSGLLEDSYIRKSLSHRWLYDNSNAEW